MPVVWVRTVWNTLDILCLILIKSNFIYFSDFRVFSGNPGNNVKDFLVGIKTILFPWPVCFWCKTRYEKTFSIPKTLQTSQKTHMRR
jgi:hypothetical protein